MENRHFSYYRHQEGLGVDLESLLIFFEITALVTGVLIEDE